MPEVAGEVPIASVLGQPRPRVSQHTFRGGNAFMLGILNKYRGELGVKALPQELDAAIRETKDYLGSQTATIAIASVQRAGANLVFDVAVSSLSGHKLPTAYPSRRAWLHVTVRDSAGSVLFESGALRANGAIDGNDNDADAAKFEPHYVEIRTADEVQVYESIMVDQRSVVTTGLLHGVRYIKDNRLLPRGFDKSTAGVDVAVHGAAAEDADFLAGGDRVRYRLDLDPTRPGPLQITVELLFQTVSYRWAANLQAYDAAETRRFVRYYADGAADSAVPLARATATAVAP